MSTHIEHSLRARLAERAAELPPDASVRLLSIDYRPRAVRARSAVAAAATILTAGVVLAVSLVSLSANPSRAFAGWSATPTAAARSRVRNTEAACRSQLPTLGARARPGFPAYRPSITVGGWHTVLVDARGPYTMVLFEAAHGRAEMSCFAGRRGLSSLGGSFGSQARTSVAPGGVSDVSSGGGRTSPDEGSRLFSHLVGRTGRRVTGLRLRLSNGTEVTASVANGWFLAWWPGTPSVTSFDITTGDGRSVRQRTGAAACSPPPRLCLYPPRVMARSARRARHVAST